MLFQYISQEKCHTCLAVHKRRKLTPSERLENHEILTASYERKGMESHIEREGEICRSRRDKCSNLALWVRIYAALAGPDLDH